MLNILSAGCGHAATAARGLAVALAAIGGFAASEAAAGDIAHPELIGFSPDGRYVAYEDYGTHNEGLPYSNIFVIDVAANAWVPGSPIRFELEFDDVSDWREVDDEVGLARTQSMEQAQQVLEQYGIVAGETGTTLIDHPRSDVAAPADEVQFSISAAFTPYEQAVHTLYLTQQEVQHDVCDAEQLGTVSIMTLELQGPNDDGPSPLQIDEDLPESRGCVTDYRIHSVVVYAPNQVDQSACCHRGDLALLVLLETAEFGFEGEDYRHMGVTAMLHDAW